MQNCWRDIFYETRIFLCLVKETKQELLEGQQQDHKEHITLEKLSNFLMIVIKITIVVPAAFS